MMSLLQCVATKYGLGSHDWEVSSTDLVRFYKVGVSFHLTLFKLTESRLIPYITAVYLHLLLLLGLQHVCQVRTPFLLSSHDV